MNYPTPEYWPFCLTGFGACRNPLPFSFRSRSTRQPPVPCLSAPWSDLGGKEATDPSIMRCCWFFHCHPLHSHPSLDYPSVPFVERPELVTLRFCLPVWQMGSQDRIGSVLLHLFGECSPVFLHRGSSCVVQSIKPIVRETYWIYDYRKNPHEPGNGLATNKWIAYLCGAWSIAAWSACAPAMTWIYLDEAMSKPEINNRRCALKLITGLMWVLAIQHRDSWQPDTALTQSTVMEFSELPFKQFRSCITLDLTTMKAPVVSRSPIFSIW